MRVLLAAENDTNLLGNFFGSKTGCRDLKQQRLKQVMIVPVDYRQEYVRSPQLACGIEAAESGANDHHTRLMRFVSSRPRHHQPPSCAGHAKTFLQATTYPIATV